MRIIESPDSVDIYYDIGQGTGFNRAIPISSRPHLPKEIRQYWGDSIGRWEGSTLVVDVTNFSKETNYHGSRENLHLIERYKRTDAKTLQITITVEDPTTWVRPFTHLSKNYGRTPTSRTWFTKVAATKATTVCSGCSRILAPRKKHFPRGKVPIRRSRTMRPAAPNDS